MSRSVDDSERKFQDNYNERVMERLQKVLRCEQIALCSKGFKGCGRGRHFEIAVHAVNIVCRCVW